MTRTHRRAALAALCMACIAGPLGAQPMPLDDDITIRRVLDVPSTTIRIAKDPRDSVLYVASQTGTISRVHLAPPGEESTLEPLYFSADHGIRSPWGIGFDIGPDGSFYIGGGRPDGDVSVGRVARGVPDGAGGRTWSLLVQTEPFPLNGRANDDHQWNEILLSPDGRFLFINNGSRTDHGQVDDNDGAFPGLRESPLHSSILRVPADGKDLVIPVAEEALRASGFLFAKGVRNVYDMAFAPNGDLFGVDNGPDRDMPEGMYWLRPGHHYGFPWRMGGLVNPQQFPDYDPRADRLVPQNTFVGRSGQYRNDPDFPPPPPGVDFTEPIANLGPDANFLRDPDTGQVYDADDRGEAIYSFTPHRSPLGLVFDEGRVLVPRYKGDAFTFSIGSAIAGILAFPEESDDDLLHLDLRRVDDRYEMNVRRIAAGFTSGPIDAEMVGNRIYVIELLGNRTMWEVTLPADRMTAVAETAERPADFQLTQNYPNPFNPATSIRYRLGRPAAVSLAVYDAAGQRVRDLVEATQPAGDYLVEWDGTNDAGQAVASGTYLYRLEADGFVQSRSLTLLK
jgi:hypothetical protein